MRRNWKVAPVLASQMTGSAREESTFRLFYNATTARTYYYYYSDLGEAGVCFGISASSILMKMPGSGIRPQNFVSSAKNPSGVSIYNWYKSSNNRLKEILEAMHV